MSKFPYGRTVVLGFGFLGISLVWPIFNQFIPIFLQAGNPNFHVAGDIVGFGLGATLTAFIMTWDNIINVFLQPWVGEHSDRTWNRFGRRKGWILLGMPIAVLGFVSIPLAKTVLAVAVFILITNVGMALFRSPTVAWLGDLYRPEQRSQANGIINLMGGIGALLAFFVGGQLFDALGRSAPFVFGALVLAAASLTAVFYVREPRQIEDQATEENLSGVIGNLRELRLSPDRGGVTVLVGILLWSMAYAALEFGLSSFAVSRIGMKPGDAAIATGSISVTFILAAVPAGFLGARFGRERIIRIGLLALTVLTLAGFLLIRDPISYVIVLVFSGAAWAFVNVNALPLVYDHGDEHRIGASTGLYYFSTQLAAILGPTAGALTVELSGGNYSWLWLFSSVFMGLAGLVMRQVQSRRLSKIK